MIWSKRYLKTIFDPTKYISYLQNHVTSCKVFKTPICSTASKDCNNGYYEYQDHQYATKCYLIAESTSNKIPSTFITVKTEILKG